MVSEHRLRQTSAQLQFLWKTLYNWGAKKITSKEQSTSVIRERLSTKRRRPSSISHSLTAKSLSTRGEAARSSSSAAPPSSPAPSGEGAYPEWPASDTSCTELYCSSAGGGDCGGWSALCWCLRLWLCTTSVFSEAIRPQRHVRHQTRPLLPGISAHQPAYSTREGHCHQSARLRQLVYTTYRLKMRNN